MLEDEILEGLEENREKQNEIVEVDDNTNSTLYDMKEIADDIIKKKDKKGKEKKKKGPSKWSQLDKKKKIIILVSGGLVLLIVVGLLLYFLVFKKDKVEEAPKEPMVIVEKDNYRYEDGKLIFINSRKKDLGEYVCTNKDADLCYVAYYSNEDEFDVIKNVYESGLEIDTRSDIIDDNYVFVYDNDKKEDGNIVLYDIDKKEKLGTYKLVKELNEDSVILKDESDKYGVMAFDGDQADAKLEFNNEYLGYILESQAIVKKDINKSLLLDMEGKELTSEIVGDIKNFNDKYVIVVEDGEYFLYDYEGNKVLNSTYNYLTIDKEVIVAVLTKKVYFFDNDGNPLNLEGIRVSSTQYTPKRIFTDKLVQMDEEKAFEIYVRDGSLVMEYDDESVTINTYEGKLSSTYEYISYFDGVLYLYSDAAKTNLLGSYTCTNKNSVGTTTTEYNNCFIAKESKLLNGAKDNSKIGYLPIYNNRYVFINDTDGTSDSINLYDLKDKKNKATYTEVDAEFYNNENMVNFEKGSAVIMAKSKKSGNYGMAYIEENDVSGLIPFENRSIKYLKDLLVTEKSDGTYHLYDLAGNEKTNLSTNYEIVDYTDEYLQVKNGDYYLVYSMDGKMIKTNDLIYVDLRDRFFLGITKDYYMEIYDYNGNVEGDKDSTLIMYREDLSRSYLVDVTGKNVKLQFFVSDGKTIGNSYFVNMTF